MFESDTNTIKPQRVSNHRHRTKTHRRGGYHRTQQDAEKRIENTGGNRHTQSVIKKGKEEILPDVLHRGAAKSNRTDNAAQVSFDECYPGTLHRDIGAGAH